MAPSVPSGSIGVRVQGLTKNRQVLVIARLVSDPDTGSFRSADIESTFERLGLPAPARMRASLAALAEQGLIRPAAADRAWRLTPTGRAESIQTVSHTDLQALEAEAALARGSSLGAAIHSLVSPALAPASLLKAVSTFNEAHNFDLNVFGMTRFPEGDETDPDPVAGALGLAVQACTEHGLELHFASDRAIVDDLWGNVAGHMWASRYGIAFFEDRRGRGMNYNLTIEVGAMLMTGRRCLLLKDESIPKMPTDLVGFIYKSVDLDKSDTITTAIHEWLGRDLALGACATACQVTSKS